MWNGQRERRAEVQSQTWLWRWTDERRPDHAWRVSLSFCVERAGHHHGNCRGGLVSIPFVKKLAPHPLANSRWIGESGFFHSNTKPCKFLAPSAFTLRLTHLVIVTNSHVKRAARKNQSQSWFYCNLLPAGAIKQETKKIVTLRIQ